MQPNGAGQPEPRMPNDQAEIPNQQDEHVDIFAVGLMTHVSCPHGPTSSIPEERPKSRSDGCVHAWQSRGSHFESNGTELE